MEQGAVAMPYKDKEDERRYQRDWYQRNKEATKRRTKESNRRYAERNRQFIKEYKESRPCLDCGGFFPAVAMDFDHLADKKYELSNMQTLSIEALLLEIEKCELVCANCHRVRTHKRRSFSSVGRAIG